MQNEYIVFVDHRFSKIVERELASLPKCNIEAYRLETIKSSIHYSSR